MSIPLPIFPPCPVPHLAAARLTVPTLYEVNKQYPQDPVFLPLDNPRPRVNEGSSNT